MFKPYLFRFCIYLGFQTMSRDVRIFELTKSFTCRVYNLHVKMIYKIQVSNKQHKFQVNLHKYLDAFKLKIIL